MQGVFSTYVEVILGSFTLEDLMNSILHVCGGDPMQDIPNNLKTGILHTCGGDPRPTLPWISTLEYSPHMWR